MYIPLDVTFNVFIQACLFMQRNSALLKHISALQDNTDELLELAQSGDDIVPSTKAQLQSSGYNKPMKVNLLGKKSVSGRSCGKVGDEDEANSGFRVNVNFTPAPQSTVTCVNQSNMRGESQMEESSSNFDIVMAELITLLQQLVKKS